MVTKSDEEPNEEKQGGLEKVLTYFPDESWYQFGLFLFWLGFSNTYCIQNVVSETLWINIKHYNFEIELI